MHRNLAVLVFAVVLVLTSAPAFAKGPVISDTKDDGSLYVESATNPLYDAWLWLVDAVNGSRENNPTTVVLQRPK